MRETLECRAVADAAQAPQPAAVAQLREMLDSQDAAIQARDSAGAVHLRTAFAAIGRITAAHPEFGKGSGTHPEQAPAFDGPE